MTKLNTLYSVLLSTCFVALGQFNKIAQNEYGLCLDVGTAIHNVNHRIQAEKLDMKGSCTRAILMKRSLAANKNLKSSLNNKKVCVPYGPILGPLPCLFLKNNWRDYLKLKIFRLVVSVDNSTALEENMPI